jgi:DNA repair protein RadC
MLENIDEYGEVLISSADNIWELICKIMSKKDLFDREKENLFVIGLNNANIVKYVDLVSVGSVRGTVAEPREIFRYAILQGASNIIVSHNHPSGKSKPSNSDTSLTKRLVSAGEILDIKVLDHVIVCENGFFYSFANEGKI